jgi:hypothetical protein
VALSDDQGDPPARVSAYIGVVASSCIDWRGSTIHGNRSLAGGRRSPALGERRNLVRRSRFSIALLGLLLGGVPLRPALSQAALPPWIPDGYRLYRLSEQQELLKTQQLGEVNKKNQAVLTAALAAMSREELEKLVTTMRAYYPHAELHEYGNYALLVMTYAQAQLRALARPRQPPDFAALLREQETVERRLAARAAIESEATAIEQSLGKEPLRALYLRVLALLRAEPGNDTVRDVLAHVIRSDGATFPDEKPYLLRLHDAAVAFARSRQAAEPNEGAWFSLEGYLLLGAADRDPAVKRLFDEAAARGATDTDTRVYPLLLARLDGEQAKEATLMKRAIAEWAGSAERVETVLEYYSHGLPASYQEKWREREKRRESERGVVDWQARIEELSQEMSRHPAEVRDKTAGWLAAGGGNPPEPFRAAALSLNLQAAAASGALVRAECDGLAAQLPRLEAEAASAYPAAEDGDVEPPPHHAAEMAAWRREHGLEAAGPYDVLSHAQALVVPVRVAVASCFVGQERPAQALQVVEPCIGAPPNVHHACAEELQQIGAYLARTGDLAQATRIYQRLKAIGHPSPHLAQTINAVAPGSIEP